MDAGVALWPRVPGRTETRATEEKSTPSSCLDTWQRVPDRDYTVLLESVILLLPAECCTTGCGRIPQSSLIILNSPPSSLGTRYVLRQPLWSLFM